MCIRDRIRYRTCFLCVLVPTRCLVVGFLFLKSGPKWMPSSRRKQNKTKCRSLSGRQGITQTVCNFVRIYVLKTAWSLGVCAENMCNLGSCLVITWFQCRSGLIVYWIWILRSQLFEYLRETLYTHAVGYLEPAHAETKEEQELILRKRRTHPDLCDGLWLVRTYFRWLSQA